MLILPVAPAPPLIMQPAPSTAVCFSPPVPLAELAVPLFMQPAPSTAAYFVISVPLAELAVAGWIPRRHDCCYKYGVGDYHCAAYAE
jgi:hypothetical protein